MWHPDRVPISPLIRCSRTSLRSLGVAAVLVLCSGAARPPVSAQGIAPETRFTPLAASVITKPVPVQGTDGQLHMTYELLLTNASPLSVRIDQVLVGVEDGDRILLSLEGDQLAGEMSPLAGTPGSESTEDPSQGGGPTTIASGTTGVVWIDATSDSGVDPPATLDNRIVASILRPDGLSVPFDGSVARVPVSRSTPVELSPPVGNGLWYMSDGCCTGDTHHRRGLAPINGQLLVPQRYAVDWYRVDDQHRAWVGDPSQLKSYLAYQQPILAAADGTVESTLDGLPNNPDLPHPPPIPPIEQTVGNFVILKVDGGYLLYGHLDPGSVRVTQGQQVSRGDVLGLIGTSGNSSAPHLHFQVMTSPTFFPTDSPPYVFDRFDLVGQVTDRIWDDVIGLQPTGTLPYTPAPDAGPRTSQMPLDRNVIRVASRPTPPQSSSCCSWSAPPCPAV
jgi:hypothetical protein